MSDRFAGKAEWFDRHYETTRGRVRLELVLERLRVALPPPPARLLDVGGGTGAYAIPLAAMGYDVTLLDSSEEWLDRARSRAKSAGVALRPLTASIETFPAELGGFDGILCHAVLMYVDEPAAALVRFRAAARDGAVMSLLEKNRDALALRPGLQGDYPEAHRLLRARESIGRLGIENRAYSIDEWNAMLEAANWRVEAWTGIRLFSDLAPDDLAEADLQALTTLERDAGTIDPYRRLARLVHFLASAS